MSEQAANGIFYCVCAACYGAFLLDRFWPWGWDGRRRSIKLKTRRQDWEQ